jgi:hypothetical protein
MQSLWHRFSYQYYQQDLEKSFQVHQNILNSFKDPKMDPEKIRLLVEYHINEALNSFLAYLEDFERK